MVVSVPWTDPVTVPTATSSITGTVKLGSDTKITDTIGTNKVYPVQVDSAGKMGVSVPWTDTNTTYSKASADVFGLIKLDSNNAITATNDKVYPVQLNTEGKAYVSVPWTDTIFDATSVNTRLTNLETDVNKLKVDLNGLTTTVNSHTT